MLSVLLPIANAPAFLGADVFFQFAVAAPNGAFLDVACLANALHVVVS